MSGLKANWYEINRRGLIFYIIFGGVSGLSANTALSLYKSRRGQPRIFLDFKI